MSDTKDSNTTYEAHWQLNEPINIDCDDADNIPADANVLPIPKIVIVKSKPKPEERYEIRYLRKLMGLDTFQYEEAIEYLKFNARTHKHTDLLHPKASSCRVIHLSRMPSPFTHSTIVALLQMMSDFDTEETYKYYIDVFKAKQEIIKKECIIRFLEVEDCLQVYKDLQGIVLKGSGAIPVKLDLGHVIAESRQSMLGNETNNRKALRKFNKAFKKACLRLGKQPASRYFSKNIDNDDNDDVQIIETVIETHVVDDSSDEETAKDDNSDFINSKMDVDEPEIDSREEKAEKSPDMSGLKIDAKEKSESDETEAEEILNMLLANTDKDQNEDSVNPSLNEQSNEGNTEKVSETEVDNKSNDDSKTVDDDIVQNKTNPRNTSLDENSNKGLENKTIDNENNLNKTDPKNPILAEPNEQNTKNSNIELENKTIDDEKVQNKTSSKNCSSVEKSNEEKTVTDNIMVPEKTNDDVNRLNKTDNDQEIKQNSPIDPPATDHSNGKEVENCLNKSNNKNNSNNDRNAQNENEANSEKKEKEDPQLTEQCLTQEVKNDLHKRFQHFVKDLNKSNVKNDSSKEKTNNGEKDLTLTEQSKEQEPKNRNKTVDNKSSPKKTIDDKKSQEENSGNPPSVQQSTVKEEDDCYMENDCNCKLVLVKNLPATGNDNTYIEYLLGLMEKTGIPSNNLRYICRPVVHCTGRPTGDCLLTFEDAKDARDVCNALQGACISNHPIEALLANGFNIKTQQITSEDIRRYELKRKHCEEKAEEEKRLAKKMKTADAKTDVDSFQSKSNPQSKPDNSSDFLTSQSKVGTSQSKVGTSQSKVGTSQSKVGTSQSKVGVSQSKPSNSASTHPKTGSSQSKSASQPTQSKSSNCPPKNSTSGSKSSNSESTQSKQPTQSKSGNSQSTASTAQAKSSNSEPTQPKTSTSQSKSSHCKTIQSKASTSQLKFSYSEPTEPKPSTTQSKSYTSQSKSSHSESTQSNQAQLTEDNSACEVPVTTITEDHVHGLFGLHKNMVKKLELRPPLTRVVRVQNLDSKVDESKLNEVFSIAGEVKHIKYYQENVAHIEYDHPLEAVQAISLFNNQKLYDKKMSVKMVYRKDFLQKKLPEGLASIGKGLGSTGAIVRGLRTFAERKLVNDVFVDLGVMNRKPAANETMPFKHYYTRCRRKPISNVNKDDGLDNNARNDNDNSVAKDANEGAKKDGGKLPQSTVIAIQTLASTLKYQGIIPKHAITNNLEQIMNALKKNPVQKSNISEKSSDINSNRKENSSESPKASALMPKQVDALTKALNKLVECMSNTGQNLPRSQQMEATQMMSNLQQVIQSLPNVSVNLGPNWHNIAPDFNNMGPNCNNVAPDCNNMGPGPNFNNMCPDFNNMAPGPNCSNIGPDFNNMAPGPNCNNMGPEFNNMGPDFNIHPDFNNMAPNCPRPILRPPVLGPRGPFDGPRPDFLPRFSPFQPPRLMQSYPPSQAPGIIRNLKEVQREEAVSKSSSSKPVAKCPELPPVKLKLNLKAKETSKESSTSGKMKKSEMLSFKNLPSCVTKEALTRKMSEVGPVLFAELTGRGRAFVRFRYQEDAKKCIRLFHRSKVEGQVIEVEILG